MFCIALKPQFETQAQEPEFGDGTKTEERKQERIRFRLLSLLPGAEARSRSLHKQLVCSFPSLLYLVSCWSELFYPFLWVLSFGSLVTAGFSSTGCAIQIQEILRIGFD